MDILLAFSPLGNNEHPHLGLPMLKSYLVNHGYPSCAIRDYNVIIMDRIIRGLMEEPGNALFGGPAVDVSNNYRRARQVMQGHTESDKLKSGVAMDLISRYLKIAGLYIYNHISFDPVSFNAIEEEFQKTDLGQSDNVVLKYIRDELVPDIRKTHPRMIGFSIVFASQILYTLLICRELKKLAPDIRIVLGGPQPTLFWKAFMSRKAFTPLFDGIIREQGEVPLTALADYWIKGKGTRENVPNMVYLSEDHEIRTNAIREGGPPDDIPTPDFRDEPLELYAYAKLPYTMTRGCYWGRCAFCGYRGCSSKYVEACRDKVINDLGTLRERHDIRIFHLMDDVIAPRYLVDVADSITRNKLDVTYAAFLRAEKEFDEKNCRILYDSGLRAVLFGFETANARVLKLMQKGISHQTIVEVLRVFKKANISNYLSCIIGFPTEEKQEAWETIDFLVNHKEIYYKAYMTPFRLFSHMIEEEEKYSMCNIDCINPMRHDATGYVSLEFHYDVKRGMSIRDAIEVLREGRKLVKSAPPGPIYFR